MEIVKQQLKDFMFDRDEEDTYLNHDNSGELKYVDYSLYGIHGVSTVPFSPNMNSFAERFIGTMRRECLDRFLIFNESQLRRILKEFIVFYNSSRPHQGIGNEIPEKPPPQDFSGPIQVRSRVFGIVNEFYREAS